MEENKQKTASSASNVNGKPVKQGKQPVARTKSTAGATNNSIRNYFQVPQPLFDPQDRESVRQMVGCRVAVRWNDLSQFPTWGSKWYRGAVEKYDPKRKQIQVKYDDSDVSWYTMSEKTFRIEGEGFLYDGEQKKWPEPNKWDAKLCLKWLLRKSAEKGDIDTITRTLENTEKDCGINVDCGLDPYGWTLLTISAEHGHTISVHSLLKHGASVNNSTKSGTTPVYAAARGGHWHIVYALIKRGADVDKPHQDGSTPLAEACYAGHTDIVKTLIECDADVNIPRKDNFTPLMAATVHGHYEVAKLLIEAGADQTIIQSDMPERSTALDRAQSEDLKHLIRSAAPASTRMLAFRAAKRFRRQWARVLMASARFMSESDGPTNASSPDNTSGLQLPRDRAQALSKLKSAQTRAAQAQTEVLAAAPYCNSWKRRFNPFNTKCLHCSRYRDACEKSRQTKTRSMQARKLVDLAKRMTLVMFMCERPGLVRVVGTRLLRYI